MTNKYLNTKSVIQDSLSTNIGTVTLSNEDVQSPDVILSKTDEETRSRIYAKKENLNVYDDEAILTFGDDEMKNIDTFANSILESTKLKDQPEVGELLNAMMTTMSSIDTKKLAPSNQSWLGKLFKTNNVKKWLTQFNSVAEVIDKLQENLVECAYVLKRDIELCNVFERKAIEYLYTLDIDIMALTLEKKDFEDAIQEITEPSEVRQASYVLDRVDSKLYNLMISRGICTIILPQMEMLKSTNYKHLDKIKMMTGPAISAWKQQATVAIINSHTQNAVKVEKAASEFTNNMITSVSKQLHTTMVESAKESTKGIADIDTLNKVINEMRTTISDVNKVLEEGRKQRSSDLDKLSTSIQEIRPMLVKK